MCVQNDVKDSKIGSEMVVKCGFKFGYTYVKTFGTKFDSITYLTTTK